MHNSTHHPQKSNADQSAQHGTRIASYTHTDPEKRGTPHLGASIVNPQTQTTTRIEIKSQPERHIINRAELAAITVALDLRKDTLQIQILTDSAFSINTLSNYTIDPLRYAHHLYKELLCHATDLIKTRDENGLPNHIGKVKSHNGDTHNDNADAGAHGVVDEENEMKQNLLQHRF